MRVARSAAWAWAATITLCLAWVQQPQSTGQTGSQTTDALQDIDQSVGPFVIAGQSFTIVLHDKFIAGVSPGVFTRTLTKLELRDRSGHVLYQKTFPYKLNGNRFQEVVTASARLLPGDNLTGLLVTYTHQPAPPGAEQSWQVFGFREGKLALFDPPVPEPAMNARGQLLGAVMITPSGAAPMVGRGPLETVELRAWTGNFYVIVPLRVDWRAGKLMVGQRCLESGGGPGLHETGCDMRVEAERVPSNAEFQFARVFPNPQEQDGIAVQHAVIAKGADVQVLKARSIATWVQEGDVLRVQFPDLWLKVLIDNNTENEGWIHGEQDLQAVGLPARSSIQ